MKALSSNHWTDHQGTSIAEITFLKKIWLHLVACGITVPRPSIELVALALEAGSLNHWTDREVPEITITYFTYYDFT